MVVMLAAELTNTMVEALVDLVSPGYRSLAKVSKDVVAGVGLLTATRAVMVAVTVAVMVGLLVFGPKLLAALGLVY